MIGKTLGHYRILETLGAGGMGEVFVAHDSKLDRRVALKVLPAAVAADPVRRDRFTREARAVAALNHPNIVTVHSVEETGETCFLTMELVEGRTLADLIPAGGLALDRLLKLAIPLADAVGAAHERGITHRDLKPANVMVTSDGRVKVLDFGLAKLRDDLPGPNGSATTFQARPLTGEGQIVGTVSYMSPEQAEGKPVDHRSDIFSLGVMLYKMATGEQPFKGDSTVSTLSSILRDTPRPITDVNPTLPRDLAKVVRRALTKDPEHRYQSAKDLRNELEELKQALDSGELTAAESPARATRKRAGTGWIWAGAGAIVVAGGWIAMSWLGRDNSPPAPVDVTFAKLTSAVGVETNPSLSPDGKWIVYASAGDIHLQAIGGQAPINLTKDEPAADGQPAFSPDGELIAFRSERLGGGLWVMGRTGDSVKRLTDRGFDPAWTPDGRFVVFAMDRTNDPDSRAVVSEGWKVEVATGQLTRITAGDLMHPDVSPNGHRIAYWALPATREAPREFTGSDRDLWTIRLDGTDPVRVTDDTATDWSPTWSPDGRFLYFASDRAGSMNLWRVAIDEASGRVLGELEAITTPSQWLGFITRSGDGSRLAYAAYDFIRNVARVPFDPDGGAVTGDSVPLTRGTLDWRFPEPSPDGTSVVLASYHRQEDLYVIRLDGTGLRQLTNDAAKDRNAHWSPDGGQIAFYSNRGGAFSFWTINADGGGIRQRVSGAQALILPLWSPDGSRLLSTQLSARRNFVFALRDEVVSEPVETMPPHPDPVRAFRAWSWSPDGRQVAGDVGGAEIWVYSFDTKGYSRVATGSAPVWLRDNRRLVYASGGRLFIVDTVSRQSREIHAIPGETLGDPSLTRDGRSLYFTHATTGADIWLMTFKRQ
jgi:Tol biopolymer transport system component